MVGQVTTHLGIDIGGMSLKAHLIDRTGKIYRSATVPTVADWSNSEFLNGITEILKQFSDESYTSVGVGTPGPVDFEKGFILRSANLKNLDNCPVVPHIQSLTSVPVYFNNDANCASLGEYYFGAGKGSEDLIVLTLGTGLGVGWVHKGKLYNGHLGNGMEAGHQTIVLNGALCGCGSRGCAEAYFSTRGLLGRYREKTGKDLTNAKDFFDLVRSKDVPAVETLEFATEVLAHLLKNLVHSINPDRIVLVGGLTNSSDLYLDRLKHILKENAFPVLWEHLRLEVSSVGAGILGAAALGFKEEV
ncbi:MAG: ROK family protein [Leptospiraceae bacterium]|nr:ROK family protein [Leptospiraceae bacterium]MCP5510478.1 ROK family protein [Leptospiraceae bacterium]